MPNLRRIFGSVLTGMPCCIIRQLALDFWENTEPWGDCLIWTGKVSKTGYGVATVGTSPGKITALAHRLAYMLANGELTNGLCVCHSCDNTVCVNPKHLWQGTDSENCKDRGRKGQGRIWDRDNEVEYRGVGIVCSFPQKWGYRCFTWAGGTMRICQRPHWTKEAATEAAKGEIDRWLAENDLDDAMGN